MSLGKSNFILLVVSWEASTQVPVVLGNGGALFLPPLCPALPGTAGGVLPHAVSPKFQVGSSGSFLWSCLCCGCPALCSSLPLPAGPVSCHPLGFPAFGVISSSWSPGQLLTGGSTALAALWAGRNSQEQRRHREIQPFAGSRHEEQ